MSTSREKSARYLPRAKKACQNCHARRVRCNVMESRPCHNCRVVGIHCELTKSKREANRERKMALLNQDYYALDDGPHRRRRDTWTNWAREGQGLAPTATDLTEPSTTTPSNNAGDTLEQIDAQLATTLEEHSDTARLSPAKSPAHDDHDESSTITMTTNDETVYIGESNLLTLVASSDGHVPTSTTNTSSLEPANLTYKLSNSTNRATARSKNRGMSWASGALLDYLNREEAFTFPEDGVTEALLQAYFKWFHPCFPVVDASQVSRQYRAKKMSPMLLQAMLFIGTSYVPDDFLISSGLSSRQDAKFHFYNRAKILFDADWEANKVAIVQTLFLISFWRSDASNDKDTRHWLASAVNFAQTRGYHRSLAPRGGPAAATQERSISSLRKRIWWSLYIRDRQCAASLGLPSRIRDEDCDVEKLNPEDFVQNGPVELPEIFGSSLPEHAQYCIQMAELAILLGKIVLKKFAPRDKTSKHDNSKLKNELSMWEERLPGSMQARNTLGSIWNDMLHLQYNHLLILLYGSVNIGTEHSSGETNENTFALEAAHRNTRIVEDMLAKDLIQYGQIHLITCMFSTLCVHVLQMRHSLRATARQLAEYRARICLMGLEELRCSWDANNWILQLLCQFLDDQTARTLNITDMAAAGNPSTQKSARAPPRRATPTESAWDSTRENIGSMTEGNFDRIDQTISMEPLQEGTDGLAESTQLNLDFMSQLLNLRDADDAFFDGTMDSDFTNAEMNLDGIFDQTSPCGVPFFRVGNG